MKKLLLTALTMTLSTILCFSQISTSIDGLWGFTTQISPDLQFVKVTKVVPGSLADISGLRVSDIIYQIDNKKVSEINDPIGNLNNYSRSFLKLKVNRLTKIIDIEVPLIQNVSSLDDYLTEGMLYRKLNSITGSISNFDSRYELSLSLLSDDTRDLTKFKTYDFEYTSTDDPLLEKKISAELGKQLNELGLSRSEVNPNLLILMNFFSGNQEKYTPPQQIISTRIEKLYNWYWGFASYIPITESTTVNGYTTVNYLFSLNIKFLDADKIKSSKLPPIVWQGSLNRISGMKLNAIDECKNAFEVLLYQFPLVWNERPKIPTFNQLYDYAAPYSIYYKYTGIVYDKKDIKTIFDIIPGSPAANAGVKKGDKILSINGNKFQSRYEDVISENYVELYSWLKDDPSHTPIEFKIRNINVAYLFCKKDTEIQALNLKISREGKKMDFNIVPVKKQMFIFND